MLTIAKLFGKSPFVNLQDHMHKVAKCIKKLGEVYEALQAKDHARVEKLAIELSELEHEADLSKNNIRKHLPKSIFLPIDRSQFLEIVTIQDNLADKAEEIGNLLMIKPFDIIEELKEPLQLLFEKNMETFWVARQVMKEMSELIESSFGGQEAEKVKEMIDSTSYKEHESDVLKHKLLKKLFETADHLNAPAFYLWVTLIENIGAISHIAEKLCIRVRLILET